MKYKVLAKQNNSTMCFICGIDNQAGVQAKFYECLNEAGEKVLLTVLTPKNEHQSYPNRMHGGVAAALLDESIGRVHWIEHPNVWGVTLDLKTRYRKPTPLNQTLYIESKITSVTSRGFEGEGKLLTKDGTVCVQATGKYFISPIETIAGAELNNENFFYVDEEIPETIEIG